MFLLKKLILWFLGAFLIAGSAFFLTPVPEKAEETAASVSAQESAEQTPSDAATPENATKSEASKGPGEQASGKPEGVKKKKRRNTYGPGTWWYEEKPEEVPQGPAPTDKDLVWIASDIHYVSPKMTDCGPAFRERLDRDDGKDLEDIDQILDRWIEEVLEARPGTVILSGDLVMDGETENHRELAEKLKRLQEDGITVLVIPGNHDIAVTMWAASYQGDRKEPAETPMNREEFLEIWHSFGYDTASASDAASLSYLYKTDEKHWFLMLDSAIYEPEALVEGRIREETLLWMEEILKQAGEENAQVIPVSHHNLLNESRLYRTMCTLNNWQETVGLAEKYRLPVWFSGHLHLQRIRSYLPEPGAPPEQRITEIVNGAFSMVPFPYGILHLHDSGAIEYESRRVKVPEEVHQNGLDEFRRVIELQTASQIRGLPEYITNNMAESYCRLMERYVAGETVDVRAFREELGYRMMVKYIDPEQSALPRKIKSILEDTRQEALSWSLPGEEAALGKEE
ncbi:MAG: metallophosphoesterase [Stomatobaculum sp.]|nr:metallophosphoesterase [Stomatobaculum sp.]